MLAAAWALLQSPLIQLMVLLVVIGVGIILRDEYRDWRDQHPKD
jgi:hypothetical protein